MYTYHYCVRASLPEGQTVYDGILQVRHMMLGAEEYFTAREYLAKRYKVSDDDLCIQSLTPVGFADPPAPSAVDGEPKVAH